MIKDVNPTSNWLEAAEKHIRLCLDRLRPKLLETQGVIEHRLKDDESAVTEMDVLVENTLREQLAAFDSGIGFGGEETGVDYDQKTFWLVDPIDGTEAFIRGLPFATNMVALIDNGQPVLGIIYNFSLDEFFIARKGGGAFCNGHPIQVSGRELKRSAVVAAGWLPDDDGCQHNILRQKIRIQPRMCSAGFELTAVARGALDGAVCINTRGKPWDFAPGTLIVQEAGGRVENILTPGAYDYRDKDLVAANPVIFDELVRYAHPLLHKP